MVFFLVVYACRFFHITCPLSSEGMMFKFISNLSDKNIKLKVESFKMTVIIKFWCIRVIQISWKDFYVLKMYGIADLRVRRLSSFWKLTALVWFLKMVLILYRKSSSVSTILKKLYKDNIKIGHCSMIG